MPWDPNLIWKDVVYTHFWTEYVTVAKNVSVHLSEVGAWAWLHIKSVWGRDLWALWRLELCQMSYMEALLFFFFFLENMYPATSVVWDNAVTLLLWSSSNVLWTKKLSPSCTSFDKPKTQIALFVYFYTSVNAPCEQDDLQSEDNFSTALGVNQQHCFNELNCSCAPLHNLF